MARSRDGVLGPRNDEWTIGDFLDRRALVETIARAAATWPPPMTIGIYGPWGEGKTSTMRMVQRAIDEQAQAGLTPGDEQDERGPVELPKKDRDRVKGTVWFDPWRYQFEDTPASSLVRTILRTAEDRNWVKPEESTACGFLKRVGLGFVEGVFRATTSGQLGVGDVMASLATALGPEALEKSFAELFQENYAQAIDDILGRESGQRLVVFLDDLDRCQPEYVVRMLEALKLTLLNPRCVYVLGIDDGVVASAIRDHYRGRGPEGDAGEPAGFSGAQYLEKIVQLPVRLPGLMDELAAEFVGKLIPKGAILGEVRDDSPEQWEMINATLLAGLRRNPRQAKRFVMLIEFTLSLARAKLEQAGQALPVEQVNTPLLVKLQLLQFSWPQVPRSAAVLRQLEGWCRRPRDAKATADAQEEPVWDRPPGAMEGVLSEHLVRWGIRDRTRQEELEAFLRRTRPAFAEIAGDSELDFHIHLAAATAQAKPEEAEPTERPGAIRPRSFTADVARTDRGMVIRLNGEVGLELVEIPAGEFEMGSPDTDELAHDGEKPRHRVEITRPFLLGVFPVTQEQWDVVMAENPSRFGKDGRNRPVDSVSWHDATAFCKALSAALGDEKVTVRLPTEAEWEYACRAGTPTRYWFGDDPADLGDHAWFEGNSGSQTHPVGEDGHGNPWGLSEMHGNVWEWCADWFGLVNYAKAGEADPAGPALGTSRVLRGGSWFHRPRLCRAAYRACKSPDFRFDAVGFRVAVDLG